MTHKSPSPSSASSFKIVLAHTDASFREKTKYGLEYAGYTVLEAADGEEALRLIQDNKPNIIMLDLVMPRLDGIHLLQKVQKEAPWATRIPWLIVSEDRTREEDIDGVMMINPQVQFVKHDWTLGHIVAKVKELLKETQEVKQE